MSWRVARSLDVLLGEINAAAPNRNKAADGAIGDAAHATRSSDHNPWVIDSHGVGVVRARDITHDPAHGVDGNRLAAAIGDLLGRHPALTSGAYVIWNRRIKSFDRLTEGWRPYTGSNPHSHHVHVSVTTGIGYDSPAGWGVMTTEAQRQAAERDRHDKSLRKRITAAVQAAKKARRGGIVRRLRDVRDRVTKP